MKKNLFILALTVFSLAMSSMIYIAKSETKGDSTKGKETFVNTCVTCHGAEGKGDGIAAAALDPKPRDLSDSSYVSSLSNEHLFKVINEGGTSVGKSAAMPAWGGALSEQDIWNVISYIRLDICKCQPK